MNLQHSEIRRKHKKRFTFLYNEQWIAYLRKEIGIISVVEGHGRRLVGND
jgi:hypothetical protein